MNEVPRAFRRRRIVLVICLGALLTAGGVGSAAGWWSDSEAEPEDSYAAAFADNDLLQRVQQGVADDANERGALVRVLELTPQELAEVPSFTWRVLSSTDSTVDVEVEFHLEDRSFSAGWRPQTARRACRSYLLENSSVRATWLECPEPAPSSPDGDW
mgnify:CR=1 FL=1